LALDERINRAFEGAGEPGDPSGVYEYLIRRRERRRMARRAKVGLLSIVVLVGAVAGVVLLSRVFATTEPRSGGGGGVAPSVQPDPTPVDVPPTGEDIGLGFPVCNVTNVAGVFTTGVNGTAWVGTKAGDVGCPALGDGMQVVAVDVTGDGVADTSFGSLQCDPWCSAFAAPDVDGDGTDELLIQNIQFTIAGLRLYDVRSDPDPTVMPVTVSSRGYPGEGLAPGAEPQLWIGGDAFDSDTLRCFEDESLPSGPGRVLIQTSATQVPPDSPDSVWHATETWFDLQPDGTVTIVDHGDFEEPVASGPPSFAQQNRFCGARLRAPLGG
jgi:hypothetical protein